LRNHGLNTLGVELHAQRMADASRGATSIKSVIVCPTRGAWNTYPVMSTVFWPG
jgi:hypothetical protein